MPQKHHGFYSMDLSMATTKAIARFMKVLLQTCDDILSSYTQVALQFIEQENSQFFFHYLHPTFSVPCFCFASFSFTEPNSFIEKVCHSEFSRNQELHASTTRLHCIGWHEFASIFVLSIQSQLHTKRASPEKYHLLESTRAHPSKKQIASQ